MVGDSADQLRGVPGLELLRPATGEERLGVFSFTLHEQDTATGEYFPRGFAPNFEAFLSASGSARPHISTHHVREAV